MFVAYNSLDEFLNATRAPVFVSNSVVYQPGRAAGQIKARSTLVLTTVLETHPVEVIGIVSMTVEVPTFEARYAQSYQPHFIRRNRTARGLVEEYVARRRPELRLQSGLLSNQSLAGALDRLAPAQQAVWELITSVKGRMVRALPGWRERERAGGDAAKAGGAQRDSSLLDAILAESANPGGRADVAR